MGILNHKIQDCVQNKTLNTVQKSTHSIQHHHLQQFSNTLLLQWGRNTNSSIELFKQLSQHHNCLKQQRWILLIAPTQIPSCKELRAMGIDSKKILMLNKKQIKDDKNILELALQSGSYSAVLSWLPTQQSLNQAENKRISTLLRQETLSKFTEYQRAALGNIH